MAKSPRGVFAAALTAAAAATLAAAPPSLAGTQTAELGLYLTDVLIAADSNGTTERVTVLAPGQMTLHDRVLTVDFAALSGKVAITAGSDSSRTCTTTATKLTCTEHLPTTLRGPSGILPEIRFKALPGAVAGTSGEINVTLSARDLSPVSTTATVAIGEGVDLAAGPRTELTAGAGEALSPWLEVGNVGDRTVHGAVVVFYGDYAFTVTKQYSNCSYRNGALTFCTFNQDLLQGNTYRSKESLPYRLGTDTEAPGRQLLEISWMTPAEFEVFKKDITSRVPTWLGSPGTGSRLELVEAASVDGNPQADPNPRDNWTSVRVQVTGENPADLAAIGGTASGAAGTVVTLDLGVKNLGPATVDHGRSGEKTSQANIMLPPGSSLTQMPEHCMALGADGQPDLRNPGNLAARGIACWPDGYLFRAGTQATFPVKLRIDEATANATGKVKVVFPFCDSGCPPIHNESNNTADVVLNATGGGLPVTGPQAGRLAGGGVVLLLAGMALLVLARRRRRLA